MDYDESESSVDENLIPVGNYTTDVNGTTYTEPMTDNLYKIPVWLVILLSTSYGTISLVAVIGNGLVLWVVSVSRRMRTVTNMFIANLALADIIIGLFAIPFQFQAALLQRWNLPEFMCAFCPFVQVLSVNVSVFTLATIALDRYKAVLHPLSARASKRKATLAIITIWLVGFIIAIPTELDFRVVYMDVEGSETKKPFCQYYTLSVSFRKWYLLALVILQYFFPLIIITAAYARMAGTLWGATAPGNAEDSRDAAILRNKKKVIKMLAVVVLLFAVCWLPLQTYNFLVGIPVKAINNFHYIQVLWFCMHLTAMSNSCCNPFIYAIYNDKFQREFRARLRCMNICQGHRRTDSPCSELSDFDRSKIRASYRFRGTQRNGIDGGSIRNHNHLYTKNLQNHNNHSNGNLHHNHLSHQNNRSIRKQYPNNNRCRYDSQKYKNANDIDGATEILYKDELSENTINSNNILRVYTKH